MRSAETRAEALFLCQQCNLRREEINLRSVPAAALASEGEQQIRREWTAEGSRHKNICLGRAIPRIV